MVFLVKAAFVLGLLSTCHASKQVGCNAGQRAAQPPPAQQRDDPHICYSGKWGVKDAPEPRGSTDHFATPEPITEHYLWVNDTLLNSMPSIVIGAGEVGNVEEDQGSALIWAWVYMECEGQMRVDLYRDGQASKTTVNGPMISKDNGYTGRTTVTNLEPGTKYTYQVYVGELASEFGTFKTAPRPDQEVAFSMEWFACVAGQFFGLSSRIENNCQFNNGTTTVGGYVLIECALQLKPDVVYTMGDMGYQDGLIFYIYPLPWEGGGLYWNDLATKPWPSVTMNEYRQTYHYNFYDASYRKLYNQQAVWATWDDHEVTNDWYMGMVVDNYPTYPDQDIDISTDLYPNAKRAYYEFTPVYTDHFVYKAYRYGKHFELISLDTRTYRGLTPEANLTKPESMLGPEQLAWLKATLLNSTATWKVIGTSGPISIVTGGQGGPDSWASGHPGVGGREWEMAEILSFIKFHDIKDVVFLTSDVHWSSVWYYQPELAEGFVDFNPFYEFVCGPTHAGAFQQNTWDMTFGPELLFSHSLTDYGIDAIWGPPPMGGCIGWLEVSEMGVFNVTYYHTNGTYMHHTELNPTAQHPAV